MEHYHGRERCHCMESCLAESIAGCYNVERYSYIVILEGVAVAERIVHRLFLPWPRVWRFT